MHLLQAVSHLLKALAQAGLQCGLQFLIHRSAHFVQFGGIVSLQLRQLLFQRLTHFVHAPSIRFAQAGELIGQGVRQRLLQLRQLLSKSVDLRVLRACGLAALLYQRLLKSRKVLRQLLAARACRLGYFAAQFTLNALQALGVGAHEGQQLLARGFLYLSRPTLCVTAA